VIDLEAVTVEDLERDPYPIYAQLREHAPVAPMPCLDTWMITRWDDVVAACTAPDTFPAHVADSPTDDALGGISMMTTDGAPAKLRRRPFDRTLRPRAVEATMPATFERLCAEQLDGLASAGAGDLVTDYFEPVSLRSLAAALGIDEVVDVPTLRRWFAGLAAGVSNYEHSAAKSAQCSAVSAEIDEMVVPLFEQRLASPPQDDLLSALIHAYEGSLADRLAMAMPSFKLVLLGGLQEPAHGGATIAHCLLSHREALDAVRADTSLVPAVVEEGLRWTAPIGNLLRGVAPNTTFAGVRLPDDARVILVVSSANRDRSVWGPTADDFDIRRPRREHLSFAIGPHYCIGHHFARVQLRTAIRLLVERFPLIRLDPEHEVVYRGHEYRSPKSVRVLVA
jgi:cytochrome P450